MHIASRKFLNYSWFILGMIFLVILAGGVVRMTQSGMGCPDWPKCFGTWIPPTDASQLPADFEKYLDQQDIDHSFNVYHTWIEYINRLLGAILGVFVFIYFLWAVIHYLRKKKRSPEKLSPFVPLMTFFLLLLTGFQGFLGKLVVDDNLAVFKVTIHMLVAIVIAAVPLVIISRLRKKEIVVVHKGLKIASLTALILVILQIILGTEVREQIDIVSKALSYEQRHLWIDGLDYFFLIHRSFSWVILAACGYLWWKTRDFGSLASISNFILINVLLSILAGLAMYWLDMPAIAQPIHLVLACSLALSIFYYRISVK